MQYAVAFPITGGLASRTHGAAHWTPSRCAFLNPSKPRLQPFPQKGPSRSGVRPGAIARRRLIGPAGLTRFAEKQRTGDSGLGLDPAAPLPNIHAVSQEGGCAPGEDDTRLKTVPGGSSGRFLGAGEMHGLKSCASYGEGAVRLGR